MKNSFTYNSNFILLLFFIFISGCYWMRPSNGGGEVSGKGPREINVNDIVVHKGYKIEPFVTGLTFPTAITFDEGGIPYVLEAGYSYGEVWQTPRLLKIGSNEKLTEIATGSKNGPWTGVVFHDGSFYVAEGGEIDGGRILKISKDGQQTVLTKDLPSIGDHHTNGPLIKDGYIYFGQGVATNSGVVGNDNADFGWLKRHPDFHDIPCADIVLTGQNYTTENVLTETTDDKTTTGAFLPYGTASSAGQVIEGSVPCSGSIMRIPLSGGKPQLVAWGFRNPFGLATSPDGKIYITDNGYDERGSRPVWGAGDVLWELKENMWYGWPDFSAGKEINNDEEFKSPKHDKVKPLLQKHPNTPLKPSAILGVHSSSNGFDFSYNQKFGFIGEAFIAQFGDMGGAGKVVAPVGFKVVRVDPSTGIVRDFAVNKGSKNGPASWKNKGGLERPVAVQFDPDGSTLYVVDFGIMQATKEAINPIPKTGMIWKISKAGS
jgi:glucose/arabinose dehydrogenase